MRARRLEQNLFDEQRALLLLSGLSLTPRRALLSGIFLIGTQISCLAAFFVRVLRFAFNARAANRLFFRCCISGCLRALS